MKSPVFSLKALGVYVLVVAAPILGTHSAIGGTKDGGGGFVVVCENDKPMTPMLLDVHEMLDKYKNTKFERVQATGIKGLDEKLLEQEIQKVLNQNLLALPENTSLKLMLKHNTKIVYERIREYLDEGHADTYLFTQVDIGNRRPIRLPVGCVPQVGAYMDPNARVSVNVDLWKRLTITDRAGLIFHESVYAIRRILFDDADSDLSRDVTATLIIYAQMDPADEKYKHLESYIIGQNPWSTFRRVILPAGAEMILKVKLVEGKKAKLEMSENGKTKVSVDVNGNRPLAQKVFRLEGSETVQLKVSGDKDCSAQFSIVYLDKENKEQTVSSAGVSCGSGPRVHNMIRILLYWSQSPISTERQHEKILGW
jgi:hypothetical protein